MENDDRRVELRRSRLVYADHRRMWERVDQPYLFVVDPHDLPVFLVLGGNGLVERSIAEQALPDLLKPTPSYRIGEVGFVGPNSLAATALRRAPTPKLRMEVLKRDRRRCRICGRTPDDDVDVVLHVHHIRPWESGGITDITNLITLCHTCHRGLDPHFDPGLFAYVEQDGALEHLARFNLGVANYRRVGFVGNDG